MTEIFKMGMYEVSQFLPQLARMSENQACLHPFHREHRETDMYGAQVNRILCFHCIYFNTIQYIQFQNN